MMTIKKLRPWSASSSERRWAIAIAALCLLAFISVSFLNTQPTDSIKKEASHSIEKPASHIATKLKLAPTISKQTHTPKEKTQPRIISSKALLPKVITPKAIITKPIITKPVHKKTPTLAKAFFIQVGAFQNKHHAQTLRKKLLANHWPTIIQTKKHLYTVQVGPYKQKKQALKIKNQLAHQSNIKGFIVSHAYP